MSPFATLYLLYAAARRPGGGRCGTPGRAAGDGAERSLTVSRTIAPSCWRRRTSLRAGARWRPTRSTPAAADPIIAATTSSRDARQLQREREPRGRPSTPSSKPVPPSLRAPVLTLYGTTIGSREDVALIAASTVPGGAQLGSTPRRCDRHAAQRLVAITDSTATLARPIGAVVLHLPPTTRQTSRQTP